ncbi:MAG: hypothetical protein F6K41_36570 [Symploca sp. SIO3E6]|nr:hypothetical protein [Caldora sp. SIO3E6]
MKTTLDIQDEVLILCQQKAQERGISLDEIINESIRWALKTQGIMLDQDIALQHFEYDLPTSGAGGVQPGVNLDRTSDLIDLMEGHL